MKKLLVVVLVALGAAMTIVSGQDGMNCFTILAGKNATADGSVLFAHNEDDYGKQLVNWFVMPRKHYPEGSELILKGGGRTGQPETTWGGIWLEIPGMDFSDSYLNDQGVCISSNSCSSREDKPEITDGGIGYNLRQIMAERATSAREAVEIGGRLIGKFGYTGSGRTYCIADTKEAWAMAVVKGKHWVARRIPDDQVMVMPNNYTIREVDLTDTQNCLGSPDIVEYAVKRGWYKPETDGPFSFRDAYAAKNSIRHPGNVPRAWGAYHLLNAGFAIGDDFPFTFTPPAKVTKQALMEILRYHYEGTELDKTDGYKKGSPYKLNGTTISGVGTVYGFVTELRSWLPTDIGCVMWLAPQWPDIQPFLPMYAGIRRMPAAYCRPGYLNSLADHYSPPADIHERNDQHAFWAFVEFSELMNGNYGPNIGWVRKNNLKIERKLLAMQPAIEKKLLKIQGKSPADCSEVQTKLYESLAASALTATRKSITRLKKQL